MSDLVVITGDLHIGSPHFKPEKLRNFLSALPGNAVLVFNGDVLHHNKWQHFPPGHLEARDSIIEESLRRRIIWVGGNHDTDVPLPDTGRVEFAKNYSHEGRVLVMHGQGFLPFRRLLRLIVVLVMRPFGLGGDRDDVLASRYSRKMPKAYALLNRGMIRNACAYARRRGFSTVVCGHTHSAQDTSALGVRYLNAGTWVEDTASRVCIRGNNVSLEPLFHPY